MQITFTTSDYHGYNVSCFGSKDGSVTVHVTGGTPPYKYLWSNGFTTATITGCSADFYNVEVTDFNTIGSEDGINLTTPADLKPVLTAYEYNNGYNISLYGASNGSISNVIDGGVSPFTYQWEDGPSSQNRSMLGGGFYSLVVTDNNNCIAGAQITLSEPERDDWTMNGNANSNPATQFIGTTDSKDFIIRTNNTERLKINSAGTISMPSTTHFDKIIANRISSPDSLIYIGDSTIIFQGNQNRFWGDPFGTIFRGIGMGVACHVYAQYSTAIGRNCRTGVLGGTNGANADESILVGSGLNTGANAIGSIVIGSGITGGVRMTYDLPHSIAMGMNSSIPTLVITQANGTGTSGNVGIGTVSPLTTFQVNSNPNGSDGTVAFIGPATVGFVNSPITGAGSRLMWFPNAGSFRAGFLDGTGATYWNTANYGTVAMGWDTRATGTASIGLGAWAWAEGDYSFAAGQLAHAQEDNSVAIGYNAIATGHSSAAIGHSSAIGGNSFSANTAIAYALNETAIGTFNDDLITNVNGATTWVATDPIFQIGNGQATQHDAVTVLKNGYVGINKPRGQSLSFFLTIYDDVNNTTGIYDGAGTGSWSSSSDERLKTNIKPLENSLSKLMSLQGVSYNWKKNPAGKSVVGFIAQDVEKIFPEVISKNKEGNYFMSSQCLTAPIVEAIKDQQGQIKTQSEAIETLNKQIESLLQRIKIVETENIELNDKINNCCTNTGNSNQLYEYYSSDRNQNTATENSFLENKLIEIVPNPFTNFTTVKYHLTSPLSTVVITFQNGDGKILDSQIIKEKTDGEVPFECSNCPSGIYFCSLWIDGKKCDTRLLVLNK